MYVDKEGERSNKKTGHGYKEGRRRPPYRKEVWARRVISGEI